LKQQRSINIPNSPKSPHNAQPPPPAGIVPGNERVDDLFENCNADVLKAGGNLRGWNNRYYTPNGNASATCDCCGLRPLAMLPPGLADNFTASVIPAGATIIQMGRNKLFSGGL
jgi:hypothetical protein